MPSLGAARSHWPVVAWVRMRLPPRPAPLVLTKGPPPPLDPPLEIMTRNPVATDPRKQIYAFEEDQGETVYRLVWDSEDPDVMEAELRTQDWGRRPSAEQVRTFWNWIRERVRPIGPLPVEAADPVA